MLRILDKLILKALEFGTGFNIIMITIIINIFIGGRGNGDIVPLLNKWNNTHN